MRILERRLYRRSRYLAQSFQTNMCASIRVPLLSSHLARLDLELRVSMHIYLLLRDLRVAVELPSLFRCPKESLGVGSCMQQVYALTTFVVNLSCTQKCGLITIESSPYKAQDLDLSFSTP